VSVKLEGIGAVVTGGGSGLGEATARALAARGARVAILDLGRSKGAEVAKSIGDAALFCEADVANEEQVTAALDRAVEAFGGLHAAVNCAGIGTAGRTVDREGRPFELRLFELTLRVNLVGTFNVIRLAAARMMKNQPSDEGERGAVVNTASVAAFEGQIGQCAYSASKGGVVGMTLPIARDLAAAGIRVNTIAPGLFATPMLMGLPQPARDQLASQIPFPQRLGKPPEFAALACHLLENPMINGETIRIDGAIRMQPR
jgi:NAD(P)-dependent dehydrogenase (short-subunit alcohol dehydrogenase family)